MPFTPLTEIDPEKAREAPRRVCEVFGVPSLHDFQEQAGHNALKGRNTILDVPTGGGKTLAFYYPLFYYWSQNTSDSKNQKIILIISPLVGLMESQAKVLRDRGIPAVAMTSVTKDLDKVLKDFGNNQYRVGFVGPEMAASSHFHKLVVESSPFQRNIITVDVDEGHEISEWGTDDFRPEYSCLSQLLAKLPSGVPVLTASATLPPEIIQDIESKLGLGDKCERISVSNEKPNVALSVRIIQHPLDSFADLAALFPIDPTVTKRQRWSD
ncbi:P-loop containing nucleoside triphosphate hydrolase protein [Lentinula edodes]|uniref:P-loop containing nucleoside triphosphate hydrolase protein n=1 Tax=Lentinula edodes TaxID=5353 RepID=UPI001E8D2306|nr:P-loop containing nucleoside triphosphate hydrolase protein [Lentinula edodes]KAH7870893.1 P-loop containing nucleoside triphosphate hydrolase protein [Lentinula edodes]